MYSMYKKTNPNKDLVRYYIMLAHKLLEQRDLCIAGGYAYAQLRRENAPAQLFYERATLVISDTSFSFIEGKKVDHWAAITRGSTTAIYGDITHAFQWASSWCDMDSRLRYVMVNSDDLKRTAPNFN